MSSFDWLSHLGLDDSRPTHYVEVSFKEGSDKGFFRLKPGLQAYTGDNVAVETKGGYDVGRITLSGELVRLQMRKKKVQEKHVHYDVLRIANMRDLERMFEARAKEKEALVKARAIVRSNDVEMKVSDVEFQGDGRKLTIYYTSEKRVDFRDLIRGLAHAFKTKIEMRQIGARQESGRLGGIGSCGRELCCSTWLSDFQSVNTAAARYQNIAINQAKLSGQCGRLKCCLNYELDTYVEALEAFPKKGDKLKTDAGLAILIKTDIFKQLMFYTYKEERGVLYPIPVKKVHEVLALNREGKTVADLKSLQVVIASANEPTYEDVTGAIELPAERKRSKRNSRKKSSSSGDKPAPRGSKTGSNKRNNKPAGEAKPTEGGGEKSGSDASRRKSSRRRKPNNPNGEAKAPNNASSSSKATEKNPSAKPTSTEGGAPKKKRNSRNRNRSRGPKKDGGGEG